MREAKCRMASRYRRAIRTGLGSVLMMKLRSFWKWGRIFGRRGALKGYAQFNKENE